MPNETQNFWKFSLDLYGRPGVADACLELQDAYNLDVNLVLFCYWHGKAYGEIQPVLMGEVIEFSAQWRSQIVQPLRNARSWMKQNPSPNKPFDSLRESIKANELQAEKFQQEQIASLAFEHNRNRQCISGEDAIGRNTASLLSELSIEQDERLTSKLEFVYRALEIG